MKTKTIKTKVPRIVYFFISLSAVFLFSAVSGFAGETVTYNGVIQGASCVQLKQLTCPVNSRDGAIASERDFVLLLPGNTHFYLPNLDRIVKSQYVGKSVRVIGNLEGNKIRVERLELKGSHGYHTVWSLEEQQEMYAPSA
jgi:hypothetical protein